MKRMPVLRPIAMNAATTAAVLAALALPAWAADEPEVNAYRPSVSNPADLPTPGQLEWGVLLGGDAQVWKRDEEGMREHGVGDTSITLKRAFIINDARAFGLELGAKLPTAKSSLGSGKTDYSLTGIYSQDIRRLHLDVNLKATRIGAPEAESGRVETGLATSLSLTLNRNWTGVAEWSGTRRSGMQGTSQVLAALSYNPGQRYSIDAGIVRGLNGATPDWAFFTGFVIPVARLW
jgi:Putative MetA-pathway of phenol degradation